MGSRYSDGSGFRSAQFLIIFQSGAYVIHNFEKSSKMAKKFSINNTVRKILGFPLILKKGYNFQNPKPSPSLVKEHVVCM